MQRNYHGQMSESFIVGILLSLTGGFQDAYTYNCRGKIFANAQTGNIVLMGQNLAEGQWLDSLRYLIPVLAFVGGVFLAQKIRYRYKNNKNIHWRQIVLFLEILILFFVGFLPATCNVIANAFISFSCAMQVDSFRKIRGNSFATTMCIGNLRSATDLLCSYEATKDKSLKWKSIQYYFFILVFVAGATAGWAATSLKGQKAVWFCCAGLLLGFLIMFIREEIEDDPQINSDMENIVDEVKDIEKVVEQKLKEEVKELETQFKGKNK